MRQRRFRPHINKDPTELAQRCQGSRRQGPGYDVICTAVDPFEYYIPQRRFRIYIVAMWSTSCQNNLFHSTMQFQKGQPLPLQLFNMHGEAEEARWSQATCGALKKAGRSGKLKKGGRQLAKPTRRATGKTTIEIDSVKFNVDLHKQLFAEYGLTWPPPPLAMGGSDREKQVIYFCEQVLPRVSQANCQSIIIDSSQQIHRVPQGFDMTPCLTPAASLFAVCQRTPTLPTARRAGLATPRCATAGGCLARKRPLPLPRRGRRRPQRADRRKAGGQPRAEGTTRPHGAARA